jgi:hypothetical protein
MSVIWSSFLNLDRFVTLEIHEFSKSDEIFEKCNGSSNLKVKLRKQIIFLYFFPDV